MYRLSGKRKAKRSVTTAKRTLTTAYKRRKDTDNIKRVKRKGMYLEIHDCNESLREMKCLVINLKRTGQEKKPNGKRVVE